MMLKEKKIGVQNGHEALLKAEDDYAEKIEKEGSQGEGRKNESGRERHRAEASGSEEHSLDRLQ